VPHAPQARIAAAFLRAFANLPASEERTHYSTAHETAAFLALQAPESPYITYCDGYPSDGYECDDDSRCTCMIVVTNL
jgi:hypothetical protein